MRERSSYRIKAVKDYIPFGDFGHSTLKQVLTLIREKTTMELAKLWLNYKVQSTQRLQEEMDKPTSTYITDWGIAFPSTANSKVLDKIDYMLRKKRFTENMYTMEKVANSAQRAKKGDITAVCPTTVSDIEFMKTLETLNYMGSM